MAQPTNNGGKNTSTKSPLYSYVDAHGDTITLYSDGSTAVTNYTSTPTVTTLASNKDVWTVGVAGVNAATSYEVHANNNGDTLNAIGSTGNNLLFGGNAKDTLKAGGGEDYLDGGNGTDFLFGGTNKTTLVGGNAGDVLTSGTGQDTFLYRTVTDSPYVAGGPASTSSPKAWDIITSHEHGSDKIDLTLLNQQLTGGGPGQLVFRGAVGDDTTAGLANATLKHSVWSDTAGNFLYADTNGDGKADLKIQVSDVQFGDLTGVTNNSGPSFTSGDSGSEAENTAITNVVYNADATDAQNDTITYTLTGTDASFFNIDASTGDVTFKVSPDFENAQDAGNNNVYDVVVHANDGFIDTTKAVAITVTDVNENPSAGADQAESAAEDVAAGVTLATISATDLDVGGGNDLLNNFENLTYAITAGDPDGLFTVDASGNVSLAAGKSLDAETDTQHVLSVTVTDGGGLSDTAQVTINVTDVDDNDPTFGAADYPATVAEDITDTTVIATVAATDADITAGTPTYAITAGDPDGLFEVNAAGEVSLAAGKSLDAETETNYVLTVTATETDGSGTDTSTVTITVTDVDEFDPVIQAEPIAATVAENISDATTIATVTATEGDLTGSVTYAITGGNGAGLFEIDATTGVITLASGQALDAETTTSHSLQVTASETDGPGTDVTTVAITVTDVDEFDPVIQAEPITATVAENISDATTIATVTATEGDLTGSVTYAITGGDPTGLFEINATTGEISLASGKTLDAETTTSHSLQVTASETDGPGTDVTTVAITVTDVDEFDPVIQAEPITATVAENISDTAVIATVTATEGDLTGSVTYSITGGDPTGLFEINATTGEISLASGKTLDAETTTSHSLQVTASETDGPGTDVTTVAITVTDVDEFDPVIQAEPIAATVAENISDTAVIATVTATEGDLTGSVTYSITGGDPTGLFEINATTGEISLASGKTLDAETTTSHSLQVTASETDGPGTDVTTVAITVTDVNDVAPTITTAAAQSVNENAAFSVALASTDPDTVGTNPATFTITGGADQGLFSIDGSGNLTMTAKNYEAPTDAGTNNTYVVEVTANDGVNSTLKTITVTVNDVNEAPTAVVLSNTVTSTPENGGDVKVADIAITDDALGTNVLSLTGADAASFSIVGNELHFNGGANFEGKATYDVTVNVNDATVGVNVPDASQAFHLDITNVNEAPTAVVLSNTVTSTPENGGDIKVADIAITDDALGTNVLSLSGVDSSFFSITGTELHFNGGNFEAKSSYDVTVNVNDATVGVNVPDASQAFHLDITNVNTAPVFDSGATGTIAENSAITAVAYDANAHDDGENSNTLTYSLSAGGDNDKFNINSLGEVTFKVSPDFEAPTDAGGNNVYDIVVHANDGTLDTTQNVAITVTNVNEVPPLPNDPATDPYNYDLAGMVGGGTLGETGTPLAATSLNGDNNPNVLVGTSGIDNMQGNGGGDTVYGRAGNDTISGNNGNDFLFGQAGDDNINGDNQDDSLYGGSGNDTLNGGNDSDVMYGGDGTDILVGNGGDDTLYGGYGGADSLAGGLGADTFGFNYRSDSLPGAQDVISDFSGHAGEGDTLDLSALDANSAIAGNDTFAFAGNNVNTVANSVTWYESAGNTIVQADMNGDTTADVSFVLTGINKNLNGSDFAL